MVCLANEQVKKKLKSPLIRYRLLWLSFEYKMFLLAMFVSYESILNKDLHSREE